MVKIDVGNGRVRKAGFITLDKTQFIDGNGNKCVDIICDVEKQPLPYEDNSVDEITVDSVLEHIFDLKTVLNEFHRVIKDGGKLSGSVPVANSEPHWQDPTHVRGFILKTFEYFTGTNPANPKLPSHPRYADYGFLPWNKIEVRQDGDIISFELSPRKV